MAKYNLEVERIKKNILGVIDDTFAVSANNDVNAELRMLRNNIDRIPVQNSSELMLLLGEMLDKAQGLKEKIRFGSEGLYSMIDSINYDVENKALKYDFKQSKLFKKTKNKATKALIKESKKNKEAPISNLEGFMKDLDRVYDDIAREKYILSRLNSRADLDEAQVTVHLDRLETLKSEKATILKSILAESTGESLLRKRNWIKGYISARTFTDEELKSMADEISELEQNLDSSMETVIDVRGAISSNPAPSTIISKSSNLSQTNQADLRDRLNAALGETNSAPRTSQKTDSNQAKIKQLEKEISELETKIDKADDYNKDQRKELDKANQNMQVLIDETASLLGERKSIPEGERKKIDSDLNSMRFKINDQNTILDTISSNISVTEGQISILKKALALKQKQLSDLENGLDIDVSTEAYDYTKEMEEYNAKVDKTRDALDLADSIKPKKIDASLSGEVEGYKSTDNFEDLERLVKASR